MRLLRSKPLQFCNFNGDDVPEYAILSHRWGSQELSYQDMCAAIDDDGKKSEAEQIWRTQGFKKIKNFSRQAFKDGYKYIWADTCCIDKSSSAELQEAINSMYQWYQNSGTCYAYLADVPISDGSVHQHEGCSAAWIESFQASEWFTRGWTLQELLAPQKLEFLDRHWKKCGSVNYLSHSIQKITGITPEHFNRCKHGHALWEVRVARRMAWAAKRQTTRTEDSAYSLLGLFDVYMPMLYGEGQRAFQRLQEEILKVDEDASILAWSCLDTDSGFAPNGLAPSAAHFRRYPDLVDCQRAHPSFVDFNATMMPRGLQVTLSIQKDLNDNALAYAVLMKTQDQYQPSNSLVLPIIFTRSTFSQSGVKNECIRFSDPLWVSSKFLHRATATPICFVRHVQATDVNRNSSGFSLCSQVWHRYATSFTYPPQTKPGQRHVPAVFGVLPLSSTPGKSVSRTLIWELVARDDPVQRFGVLIDYLLTTRTMISETTVTVIKLKKPMHLAWASHLAKDRNYRRGSTHCPLPDCDGRAIPTDKIVDVGIFQGYWLRAGDSELESLPTIRPGMGIARKELNLLERRDV